MGLFGKQKSSDSGKSVERQSSSDASVPSLGSFGSFKKVSSLRRTPSDGREMSQNSQASAGGKSQSVAPSTVFEMKTPGQVLARVEVIKLDVAELEKECIKLESQLSSASRVVKVEQRVDDDLHLQRKKYDKAVAALEDMKKESQTLAGSNAGPKVMKKLVQRYGDRILDLEIEEMRERDEHNQLLKAIAEQENIMRALETQSMRCPRVLNSKLKVPPKFSPNPLPEFHEWRQDQKQVFKLIKSEEKEAERRKESGVEQAPLGVSVSAASSMFGGGGGSDRHGAFPDANRSSLQRVESGKKKPSKWSVEDPAARSRDRSPGVSRSSSSTSVVKAESVKETDVLQKSASGSVKNLFAKFDSGEVSAEEKAHAPNDAMLELQKIQKRSSSKELVSSFEHASGKGSHDEEFKNKEFDKSAVEKVHLDKKFLM
ncbi:hypothetical protein FVE85_6933 [Porphyridium purpureum]|uniref:Uncharacterized protein n=1 Tax=Porphyridium purpureum TaxID=35688 RepID=A0A5J4Z876_PORPP|nr:hypothetical protein FVE85_6933 [Porphyridium purpureum]|eukprot:POR4543..scf295_1